MTMVVLDLEKVRRSNWLDYCPGPNTKEHRGYYYDPDDPKAFHTTEEIDDHIERTLLAHEVECLRGNPDLRKRFRERLAEHPEARAQWEPVLAALGEEL